MKKNLRRHDALDFITLKTNTMKTDANLHPFALQTKFYDQKFVILPQILKLFYIYKYILKENLVLHNKIIPHSTTVPRGIISLQEILNRLLD